MTETQWVLRELEASGVPDDAVKTARELLYRVRTGACSRSSAESLIDDIVRRHTNCGSLKEVLGQQPVLNGTSGFLQDAARKERKKLIDQTRPRWRLNPAVYVVFLAWVLAALCGLGVWKAWELVVWWKGGAA